MNNKGVVDYSFHDSRHHGSMMDRPIVGDRRFKATFEPWDNNRSFPARGVDYRVQKLLKEEGRPSGPGKEDSRKRLIEA